VRASGVLRVQAREHGQPQRAVAHLQRARERPAGPDVAAGGEDARERIRHAFAVVRLLVDPDVRHQPEGRAAPVGAAPRLGAVQAAVAGTGQALGQTLDEVDPDRFGPGSPDAQTRERLRVGREALLGPRVVRGEVREAEVEQLVREDPVPAEPRRVHIAAHLDADRG
jgi:hypothetical protein